MIVIHYIAEGIGPDMSPCGDDHPDSPVTSKADQVTCKECKDWIYFSSYEAQ